MEIIQAYFTKHPCMGKKKREIHPVGIFAHSTGSVNRELRRYVDEPERLGRNLYNNHWNKANATKSVHAFIGYDKNNHVIVAETLPHDVACWGAGSGKKGSYNYDPHAYLQFEICQGSTSDMAYYWEAIKVAEEYCAHLCRIYGWTADNITSHAEAHSAGYASNHGDPLNWMKAFGDDMDKFRMRVRALLDAPPVAGKDEKPEDGTQEPTVDEGAEDVKNYPTIRKGDSGEAVKRMQMALQKAGYEVGEVDGKYGSQTISAVRAFQYDHGLTSDGICGPATWKALIKTEMDAEDVSTSAPSPDEMTVEERLVRLETAVFGGDSVE